MNAASERMNCRNYREAIAADPSESFEGGAEHAAQCASCAAYKAEIRTLDDGILRALRIDTPDLKVPHLPPIRAGRDNVVKLPARKIPRFTTPAWIGIAASVLLAVVIGVQLTGTDAEHDRLLAEQVLAHVDHEPWALKVTDVAVSEERFNRVVNPSIGSMDRNIGLVSYAQTCIINGRAIPHLVIQGEKGPVTLLLMPHETVSGAVPLSGESVDGVILPHGDGSIAIIGEREERIQELGQRVVNSVEWRI